MLVSTGLWGYVHSCVQHHSQLQGVNLSRDNKKEWCKCLFPQVYGVTCSVQHHSQLQEVILSRYNNQRENGTLLECFQLGLNWPDLWIWFFQQILGLTLSYILWKLNFDVVWQTPHLAWSWLNFIKVKIILSQGI